MINRIITISSSLVFAFLLSITPFSLQAHAKPKKQYPTCAYKTSNMIKKPKVERFKGLKKCTLGNAARKSIKVINWFYKDMLSNMQRKAINKELRKMMKKHPNKRKQLRAKLITKLSLSMKLKSYKGKIINRSRKNCRIKFSKIIVRIKSCQTSRGL